MTTEETVAGGHQPAGARPGAGRALVYLLLRGLIPGITAHELFDPQVPAGTGSKLLRGSAPGMPTTPSIPTTVRSTAFHHAHGQLMEPGFELPPTA